MDMPTPHCGEPRGDDGKEIAAMLVEHSPVATLTRAERRPVVRSAHTWRRAGKLYRPSLETRPLAHTSATPNTASASL